MLYRQYGDLDHKISQLGFGAMRLPKDEDDNIDTEASVRLLREAHDRGVNYYDTALVYNSGESEKVVGEALSDRREDVYIATKIPIHMDSAGPSNWRELMEDELERLQTDYIDFWHFHDLKYDDFNQYIADEGELLRIVRQAREDGLINHICFSSHESPDKMIEMLETGYFEGILLQYNLLDRSNEKVIDYCREEGIGVVVMGPVGGGQLARPSKKLLEMSPDEVESLPDLALRYVLSNGGVSCALSGMSSMDMMRENTRVANTSAPLSDNEVERIEARTREMDRLAELYCTGCGYCMPCPQGVNIPKNFKLMNDFQVYGFQKAAREDYASMPTSDEADDGLRASECVECGECADKCPQDIDIPRQLQEVDETLSKQ